MFKNAVFALLLFTISLSALEIQPGMGHWRKDEKIQIEPDGSLKFSLSKQPKKLKYHPVFFLFRKAMESRDLISVSFDAKAAIPIPLQVILGNKKASLSAKWSKKKVQKKFTHFEFRLNDMKSSGDSPLKKIEFLKIGIALWAYDTTRNPLDLEIRNIRFHYSWEEFTVPRPNAAVGIDAEYRKDWGFEDVLYFWTPPTCLTLAGENCRIGRKLLSENDFSGKFSFMFDEQDLYFLALIKDRTPCMGKNKKDPWLNDSIELFLAPNIKRDSVTKRIPLSRFDGLQITFDCGHKGAPTVWKHGRVIPNKIRYSLRKCDIPDGKRSFPGYVLEAAIPFSLFDKWIPKRGQLFGYCINLNGQDDVHLRSNKKAQTPFANVEHFNYAYLEQKGSEQQPNFQFGKIAENIHVPSVFNPVGQKGIWDSSHMPLITENEISKSFSLNGYWAVQGVEDEGASADPSKWSYSPIPGNFTWDRIFFRKKPGEKKEHREKFANISRNGKRSFYWFERTFSLPFEWKNRQLILKFAFLRTEGLLYINKKYAGTITSLCRDFDITSFAEFGKDNRIDIRLYAPNIKPATSLSLGEEGITGDVSLEVNDFPAKIKSVLLRRADGLTGAYTFEVDTSAETGKLELEIFDSNGKSLHKKTQTIARKNIMEGKCGNFPAWSIEKPDLCTAVIKRFTDNGELQEIRKRRFGFRTWENKNGRFCLNGKKVRLRMAIPGFRSKVMDPGTLPLLKKLGFNSIYLHSVDTGWMEPLYNLCDQYGFMILAPVRASASDKETVAEIHALLHHPSIYGYISDPYGQFSSNGFLHNPFSVDDRYMPSSSAAESVEKIMLRRDALFRSADPSRRYISHATGNWRDTMRITHYYPTNVLNLLDRAMYHQPWSRRKEKLIPLNLIEAGVQNLIGMDTRHPTDKMPVMENRRMVNRELLQEAASRYLGNDAFRNWYSYQNLLAKNGIRAFRLNGVDAFTPWMEEEAFAIQNFTKHQDFQDNRKLSYSFFTEPYANSLEHGWMRVNTWYYKLRCLPRIPFPEYYGRGITKAVPSPLFRDLYMNIMQPLYASITAGGEEVFTRDHNYYSGEQIRKSVTVCNDTENDVPFSAKVTLESDGNVLAVKDISANVPQGEILKIPFEFDLPKVKEKRLANLRLDYRDRTEEFPISVFPKTNRKIDQKRQKITVLTREKISLPEKYGLTVSRIDDPEKLPESTDLLIIEKGMFQRKKNWTPVADFVNRGGRLLVMEQTGNGLFSHRLTEQRLEQVFRNMAQHPILNGLTDQDLSFWRGRAETVQNEVRPSKHYRHSTSTNLCPPHLTNRNIVAGYALRNFPYGSVTNILSGGFDRDAVVLTEIHSGKGRAVFCQLDVSQRIDIEPAAAIIAGNLLDYSLTPVVPRIPAIRYSGDEKGKKFLKELGIPIDPDSPIGVAGADAKKADLAGCRTILFLPSADEYPKGIQMKKTFLTAKTAPYYWGPALDLQYISMKGLNPSTDFPNASDPVFAGITPNDLFWFENPAVKTFSSEFPAKRSEKGVLLSVEIAGISYIFCGADPAIVNNEGSKAKVFRIWSQIFANLHMANEHQISFSSLETDLSDRDWLLITDPAGNGEQRNFPLKTPSDVHKYAIKTGKVWEEQGVTSENPHMKAESGNAYDGYAWYILNFQLKNDPKDFAYLHVNGIRDVPSPGKMNYSQLYINGRKIAPPVGIWNGFYGGIGARLWKIPAGILRQGKNRLALQIYNANGPGGIHKNPVRFEKTGKNQDMLLPYRFNPDKYTNDFFWCW